MVRRSATRRSAPEARAVSFVHLVCPREQHLRDGEAERPRGFQVDDEFEFGWLLYRQICRFLAVENAAGINARLAIESVKVSRVADQAACHNEGAGMIDRRQAMTRCQCREPVSVLRKHGI